MTQQPPREATASRGALLAERDIRRYVGSRLISGAGSAVTYVALPVLVYGLTGSALWTAFVTVAEGLPYLLLGLIAGALADRVDRRQVMVAADLVCAASLATLPIAHLSGGLAAWHVILVALVAQTAFVFFDAANFGALPQLVGRDRLVSASSLVFGAGSVIELVVPPLAGLALVLVHPADLIALDAMTFVASALLVRSIIAPLNSPGPRPDPHLRQEIRSGLSFLWNEPVVRTMTFLGTLQAFAGGAFVGLFVVWADRTLGVREGDWRLGVLFGAWGAGAVIGSAVTPTLVRRLGAASTALVLLPLSAMVLMATLLAATWSLAVLGLAMWAGVYTAVVINAVTVRQLVTPGPLQSRVNSTGRMLSFGIGYPLGAAVSGALAEILAVQVALAVSGLAVVFAGVLAWVSPLRGADIESIAARLSEDERAASAAQR